MLAALWERNLPVVRERVGVLEQAAAAAVAGTLSTELRAQAASDAHKLAGSLGMFGYPRGTELARAIEVMLGGEVEAARLAALAAELRTHVLGNDHAAE
jgi:HPt (histidine-containing phosphotransfer) domain-containing protein